MVGGNITWFVGATAAASLLLAALSRERSPGCAGWWPAWPNGVTAWRFCPSSPHAIIPGARNVIGVVARDRDGETLMSQTIDYISGGEKVTVTFVLPRSPHSASRPSQELPPSASTSTSTVDIGWIRSKTAACKGNHDRATAGHRAIRCLHAGDASRARRTSNGESDHGCEAERL